ncbi:MAG: hypothetical protein ACI9NT_000421 [Bacteroidia bacterium]|jgi:hypothetical protein
MSESKKVTDHNDKESVEDVDNSLRGRAMQRALGQQVPTTLTPHEWEQWYKEHGMPEAHRQTDKPPVRRWLPSCKWFGPTR